LNANSKIYLDYNATTPVDPRVLDEMLPYFSEVFGNASSDHSFGWHAQDAVDNAREQVANLVNCRPTEITFTSGATEAANLALFGFCQKNKSKGNHIITCKTEHKAVLENMKALKAQGFEITYLDVNAQGEIDLDALKNAITDQTILVCIMLANNETGVIQPLKEIVDLAHAKNVAVMTDATQAVGKIPVDFRELDVDLAIFSSHKIYGPKGVGALFINKKNKIELDAYFFGGSQEKGLRPGTLNHPGIVGFGKACALAFAEAEQENSRLLALRNQIESELATIEGAIINGAKTKRLPNTTNVSFENVDGSKLLLKLNKLAVSRGSACTANLVVPSHVLLAMGHSEEVAFASLRISLGHKTTQEDVAFAAAEIKRVVNELRSVTA
tara:strand:+ start:3265 stop:4419 length:1155 start_codon:yes stop_codon:yes gene_type:complete